MFQTEIHHFLQSFSNPFLDFFMQVITALGHREFFMVFMAFLLFGIHFKKGFVMAQVLLWTGLITYIFKHYFALPRPFHVDSSVLLLESFNHGDGIVPFLKQGATSFWGLLPSNAVDYYRNLGGEFSYGFPSGHTSVAVTVWGALALMFRKKWLTYLSIALIVLIPFSRIYLGVHFLADVIGGYVLGGLILWIFYQIVLKPSKLEAYLQKNRYALDAKTMAFILSPLLFLLLLPPSAIIIPAAMLGFNAAFYLLGSKSLPVNVWNWQAILGSLLVFALLFGGLSYGLKSLQMGIGIEGNTIGGQLFRFMRYFGGTAVSIVGTVLLGYRLGWMENSNEI